LQFQINEKVFYSDYNLHVSNGKIDKKNLEL